MEYTLDISERFKNDLSAAVDCIARTLQNIPAAERLAAKAKRTLSRINDNPYIYPVYHDDILAAKGYRFAVVSNYLIFYRISEEEKTVHITNFIYAAQNMYDII